MRTFGGYCRDVSVPPEAIDGAATNGFAETLTACGCKRVAQRVAELREQLNAAAARGDGWPGPPVAPPVRPD